MTHRELKDEFMYCFFGQVRGLVATFCFANQRAPKHVSEALIRTKTKTLLVATI